MSRRRDTPIKLNENNFYCMKFESQYVIYIRLTFISKCSVSNSTSMSNFRTRCVVNRGGETQLKRVKI